MAQQPKATKDDEGFSTGAQRGAIHPPREFFMEGLASPGGVGGNRQHPHHQQHASQEQWSPTNGGANSPGGTPGITVTSPSRPGLVLNPQQPAINWAVVPLVTGTLYVKYGTAYVLCDCKLDSSMLSVVPIAKTDIEEHQQGDDGVDDEREAIDIRVEMIEETKLLNFYHYYDNYMFELVVRGSIGRYRRASFTELPSEEPTTTTASSGTQPQGQGNSGGVGGRKGSFSGLTDATALVDKPLPQLSYRAPKNASDFVQHSSISDAGHQGGSGFTVLTFKSFSLQEMGEWVDALQEVHCGADTVTEYSTGDAPRRRSMRQPDDAHPGSSFRVDFAQAERKPSLGPEGFVNERRLRSSPPLHGKEEVFYSGDEEAQSRLGLSEQRRRQANIAPSRKPITLEVHKKVALRLPVYGQGFYAVEEQQHSPPKRGSRGSLSEGHSPPGS